MFTLDEITLYYHQIMVSHETSSIEFSGMVEDWSSNVASVPFKRISGSKAGSRASTATAVTKSAPSTLTESVQISEPIKFRDTKSTKASKLEGKTKAKPRIPTPVVPDSEEEDSDSIEYRNGGLDDSDERHGAEADVAASSPHKGNKRVTSEVRALTYDHILALSLTTFYLSPS